MTTRVLICDDSNFARRLMAKALPDEWDITITEASNGKQALTAIRAGQGEILFLDLNMPEMDGYQVLEQIQQHDLPAMTIVVSGDIQPKAEKRVRELGALAFIRKPFQPEQVQTILKQYGLLNEVLPKPRQVRISTKSDYLDIAQELANVAIGQAGDRLARWLDIFISQPIPKVLELTVDTLEQRLKEKNHQGARLVRQGFIGGGLAGEALFICEVDNLPALAKLAEYPGIEGPAARDELLLDMGSIMIGAFLSSLAEQLDTSISQRHPQVLNTLPPLKLSADDKKVFCIELPYQLDAPEVDCVLYLLLSPDRVPMIRQRLNYFMH